MTPYELYNLQKGIGDLEGLVRLQKINPTAFTPTENMVINHLKMKKDIKERERARQQEKELQKEIDRFAEEVAKEVEKRLKL